MTKFTNHDITPIIAIDFDGVHDITPIIAIDFDGVIVRNAYPKIGELMPGVKDALSALVGAGYRLIVHSVRANDVWSNPKHIPKIAQFIDDNDLPVSHIWQGQGKPLAHFYIDDRAIRFEGDWPDVVRQILAVKKSQRQYVANDPTVKIFITEQPSEGDILKGIDRLAHVGGYEIDIRKAIDSGVFEYWFLQHIFENNLGYFTRWKERLYEDMAAHIKAQKYPFPMNESHYNSLQRFLSPYRDALVYNATGWQISPARVDALQAKGLLDAQVLRFPDISYKLGMLHEWIVSNQGKWGATKENASDFFRLLTRKAQDIPLSAIDRNAIAAATHRAHAYLKPTADNVINGGLASLYGEEDAVNAILVRSYTARHHPFVTGRQLRNALANQRYQRDYDRVARTEILNDYNQGVWGEMVNKMQKFGIDPKDAEVYRIPSPHSCQYCKLLYLQDDHQTPRRYKFLTISGNGTNYDLRPVDWKPVIGSTHPNCRCSPWYRVTKNVTEMTFPKIMQFPVAG